MSRVGRLAGALLAESDGHYFLVGNTKAPCDWAAAGFEPPGEIDAIERPFVRLVPRPRSEDSPQEWSGGDVHLVLNLEGEDLAATLAQRFVIERNGSVSERLWRLVVHRGDPDADEERSLVAGAIDARWLAEIPAPIWQVVRDTVLRCI